MKTFALLLLSLLLFSACIETAVQTKDKVVETAKDVQTAAKETKEAIDSVKEISK